MVIFIYSISISNHLKIYNILLSLLDVSFCLFKVLIKSKSSVRSEATGTCDHATPLLYRCCWSQLAIGTAPWVVLHDVQCPSEGWCLATSSFSWGSSNSAACSPSACAYHGNISATSHGMLSQADSKSPTERQLSASRRSEQHGEAATEGIYTHTSTTRSTIETTKSPSGKDKDYRAKQNLSWTRHQGSVKGSHANGKTLPIYK